MGWLKDTAGSIGSWGWNNLVPDFKSGTMGVKRLHMGGSTQAYSNVLKAKSGMKVHRPRRKIQKKKK